MPIKTKEELFGDDGANGPAANVDTSPPAGYGANNRAVGLGEGFTSAVANRTGYALAENDEDLDSRIAEVETTGLDAAYRLAGVDEAGGGRVIHVDGGAVEAVSELGGQLETDRGNALVRASALADTVDGAVGFDFEARAGGVADPSAGVAVYGFLDRRYIRFNSANSIITLSQAGTLHDDSDPKELKVAGGARFANSSVTEIIIKCDLVEVLSGTYAGLYVIWSMPTDFTITLRHLDGSNPSFAADTAVTFRICRPVFSSAGRQTANRPLQGVSIAGLPTDGSSPAAGALTLIPGGRRGVVSPSEQGMRYALRTRVLEPQVGQERWAGSITAAGGFETQSGVDLDPAATDAKEFGWAGYKCVTDADESPYCVGFAALARDDEAPFYGLAAQVRSSSGFAGTYATGVISLDAPADLPTSWVHGLVEVVVGSTSFGIYRVTDSNLVGPGDTGTITLETLAQNTTITIPAGAVTVYVLSGAEIGRVDGSHAGAHLNLSLSADESLTATPFDGVASARFTSAPEAIAGASPIVLALSAQTQDAGSVLIRGSRPDQGETFVVRADGRVAAKVGFRAPTVCATNYRFPSAASLLDFPIPLDVMKDDGAPFISGNYRPVWYRNPTGGWSLDPPNVALIYRALTIPLSGILPYGATVNSFKLYYETLSWLTDQSFRFQIYRRDAFDDSPTILQTTVLTAKASPGTLSITVSVPFQLTRSGATYAAHITSRNATDVTHADNIMVLHGVFASCTLKSLFPDS